MPGMDVVFVHGSGRAGVEAWPLEAAVAEPGWQFLTRVGPADDALRDCGRVLDLLRAAGGGHVVASSYGANAALLAAQHDAGSVRSLALLEPACFDLARGRPAVDEHVAAMTPVFAVADDAAVPDAEFSRFFADATGTPVPELPEEQLREATRRLRAIRPPWGLGLREDLRLPVRTLVVTGGERPLYEQTAAALVLRGARHVTLEGAGHRVQDDPRLLDALREHWVG